MVISSYIMALYFLRPAYCLIPSDSLDCIEHMVCVHITLFPRDTMG